jgi:hypothetical protein
MMERACRKAFRRGFWRLSKSPKAPNERPPAVRYRKADLHSSVKSDLVFEFTGSRLTSYAGLELFRRYLRLSDLNLLLRRRLDGRLCGDFGAVGLVRLILALLVVGGRRLGHVDFLRGDPMILRFAGLQVLPTPRTVSRWLQRFHRSAVEQLRQINAEVIAAIVAGYLSFRTLTIDIDGTVLSTGLQVERAFRGYNPHHRKVPSYYPITAHLAETGHVLRVQNRSGNVSDGKASIGFLRDLFRQVEETLGAGHRLQFRMDGEFFKDSVFRVLETHTADYAIKVPFWPWLNLKSVIVRQKQWQRVDDEVDGYRTSLFLEPWQRDLRLVIYRKRVRHLTAKNYQLDLFDPNDGYWEYSAVATNLSLSIPALWKFMCGRGSHEKTIGELKTGLAFDSIPTRRYGANSAWQQLVVLAHNLLVNFQIETGATKRKRSPKRTAVFLLRRAATLRFELFNRAGHLVRPRGAAHLRLLANERVQKTFSRMLECMAVGS